MNIKEYISSGIVESYVLGLATEQERMEFEQLCEQYPELIAARTNFELLLEKRALENEEAPPVDSKDKIWSAIQQAGALKTSTIITMESTTPRRSSGSRLLAAASIILMLVAGYFAYDFYTKNTALQQSNAAMQERLNSTDSVINKLKDAQAKMEKEHEVIGDQNTKVVVMSALKESPNPPSASVYWDTASSNVYLMIKNMPQLPSDKQYQLWSLLNGKPTSLGLFDGGEPKVMLQMNKAQKADAFAITIEDRGNTNGPNLEQLQIMGKTKL